MVRLGVVVLLMLTRVVCAQQFNYTLRHYSAVHGLPQSQVNVILEDKNGYLWIGTQGGGLARFDGNEFKVYTTLDGLLSNIVTFLKLDSKDNLWIVHPRGITKFDGVGFTKFVQPEGKLRRIRRVLEFNDTIMVYSSPGVLGKIYQDSVYTWGDDRSREKIIQYIYLLPSKALMLCMSDSSVEIHDRSGRRSFSYKNDFNYLQGIFKYNGQTWARTDAGFAYLDEKNGKFIKADLPLKNHFVHYDSITQVFWSRHENFLLREYRAKGQHKVDTVLRDVEVTQVLADSELNTWIGTLNHGLYKYFIQDFEKCSSEKMRTVMAIHKDRGGASWIGTQGRGLWRMKSGESTHFFETQGEAKNYINDVAESATGDIWIATSGGLARYDEQKNSLAWITTHEGLSHNAVFSIQFDEAGGMWLATYGGGINYYDGKKFSHITSKDGLSSNAITAIHYSSYYKSVFFGNEFGMGQYKDKLAMPVAIAGAENTSVLSIHPYKDSLLLIGTSGAGFSVYNPNKRTSRLFTVYDGLPSGFIYFVAADAKDFIWVGTEKGISKLRLNNQLEVIENIHYGYNNGLTGVETNQNAFYLSEKEKYFGLLDGLYQFNEFSKKEDKKSFKIHLTSVEVLYGETDARKFSKQQSGFFRVPVNPEFEPDKNHLTFRFNRVDKSNPESVRYQYCLSNYDKKWSPPSANNYVTYSNLPPGEYIFKVKATDAKGGWSEGVLIYNFIIKTPFYRTPAFILGAVILLIGTIILILYLRVKNKVQRVMELERIRTHEQEILRKEIARDFHDEMGNQLTRIINYVSLLKLNGNNYQQQSDLYTKVENSAKYLYTGTRDFIWSIDPVNDELSKLFIHIRDFGEKLFEEKNIQFRAYNSIKQKVKLPYGFSREANLIFKEAMTNAFKYSGATNVTLSLFELNDDFQITFEDDGIGFNAAEIENSNGLKNIRERADRINAILRISSSKHKGTRISLQFKLNKTLKYGLAL